tara:strand:+ start:340 stop:1269 length:930 start_codon:yes stop_codon:yes gene_type:complete
MKQISIDFVDFWPAFKKDDNYFFHLLKSKYSVVIDEFDPDLVFFSVDYTKSNQRQKYINHRSKKIFYTGENVSANLYFPASIDYPHYSIGRCDFSFSFEKTGDPRNYRFPLWAFMINWFDVENNLDRDPSYLIPIKHLTTRNKDKKNKFCNFLFSNHTGKREEILDAISSYKKVDCAGGYRNNMGRTLEGRGDQKHKIDFISDYKFTIASENSVGNGYVTEKIIHPLSVGSVPIYWGSDFVKQDFNEKCFINYGDYDTIEEFMEKLILVDSNKEKYEEMISQPIFKDNKIPDFAMSENVLRYFEEIVLC